MAKQSEVYLVLRDKGMTYEEIGEIYGLSKQAVWEAIRKIVHGPHLSPCAEATILKIKYEGLMNWMLNNNVKLSELERLCGGVKLREALTGSCEPRKKNIDAILAVTGLTYEECFKERVVRTSDGF